ncbi:hypothetical protein DTL21_28235 [Bremerella cremea]|uniref:Uncharacterized protein n=1 Tax=Blastopirellula marina TaxID=124 RepID=A0A2S8F8K2_9BACT|nr:MULTISPECIES: hypothetical protein [Pirellulaceae]PQO28493.1 hypothetical protein C5Y83_28190 [Blastopirellula marina]RCS41862.1 hypothetical protein DTL21_28235 [Bremerella cremea]
MFRCFAVSTLIFTFYAIPLEAADENVDTSESPENRVAAMWKIIDKVVSDLDSGNTSSVSLNKKKFLLHVAWHEGAFLKHRKQIGGGPGRSFFQFEAPLAKDAVLYAKQKNWLGRLASASGKTENELETAANAITGGSWPDDNAIEESLLESDLFGTYLARIALKRIPQAIPTGNAAHAEYWADHWKRVFSSPEQRAELIERFENEADDVDQHIP